MKSRFLSTENILHTYILILSLLLRYFNHLFFSLPPKSWNCKDSTIVMYRCPCHTLLTVSEAQLVESDGGHGEDPFMRPPQGTQTAGAVTELLKPCS